MLSPAKSFQNLSPCCQRSAGKRTSLLCSSRQALRENADSKMPLAAKAAVPSAGAALTSSRVASGLVKRRPAQGDIASAGVHLPLYRQALPRTSGAVGQRVITVVLASNVRRRIHEVGGRSVRQMGG